MPLQAPVPGAAPEAVVIEHLMKLQASPATEPCRGWEDTVRRARLSIKQLLEDNPSLRPTVAAVVARLVPDVREIVAAGLDRHGETPRVKLEELRYDANSVTGRFLPPME